MPKPTARKIECLAIITDDRPSEPVRSRPINLIERGLEVGVIKDIDAQNRPEVFGGEDLVSRVVRHDQRRSHVPALAVVGDAAGDDLGIG
jgi:hypothetical protein